MEIGRGSGVVGKKIEETKHARIMNIQLLVVRLLPHSPSSLECEENKTYNEKRYFA